MPEKGTNADTQRTGVGYIRVSTSRQEELSPAAQKRELLKYAKEHDIILLDFYYDDGISGREVKKRQGFKDMIAFAKSPDHPIDCILVWKFSRFARNQEESIVYKALLRKNKVDVISITEYVEGPFGSLIERIIEWMDEYYSIRLAGDVMRGMKEKALRGGYQSASPYGYKMNKETHIPEIYAPEIEGYHMMIRLCEEKKSLTTIARMVNDAGYRTRRGNKFEFRTIYYILANPFYAGKVRWNRAEHGVYRDNDSEEIIIVDGAHEPAISKERFDHIQELIKDHKPGNTGKRRKAEMQYRHYLCGLLKCPTCGANLAFNNNAKSKYFTCWRYAKGMHPSSCHVSQKKCEENLMESLQQLLQIGSEHLVFRPKPITKKPSDTLERYQATMSRLEQKERRIKEAYIDGIDTKEEYRENKERLAEERARLEELIRQETADLPSVDIINSEELIVRIKDIIQIIQDDEIDIVTKHNALASILEKVIYDRETDEFEFFYLYT